MREAKTIDAELDELWLDLDQFCRAAGVDAAWVRERMAAGLLTPQSPGVLGVWRLDTALLKRVRCMLRVERDFEALPELAALVADLEAEIARLRERSR